MYIPPVLPAHRHPRDASSKSQVQSSITQLWLNILSILVIRYPSDVLYPLLTWRCFKRLYIGFMYRFPTYAYVIFLRENFVTTYLFFLSFEPLFRCNPLSLLLRPCVPNVASQSHSWTFFSENWKTNLNLYYSSPCRPLFFLVWVFLFINSKRLSFLRLPIHFAFFIG